MLDKALGDAQCSGLTTLVLKSTVFKNDIDVKLKKNRDRIERGRKTDVKDVTSFHQGGTADLGHFNLQAISFQQINIPTDITVLYLDNCRLSAIPEKVFGLVHLTTLVLVHNRITVLPPALFQMTSLVHVNMSNNLITKIPPEITNLTRLVSDPSLLSPLSSFPSSFSPLLTQAYLSLGSNGIGAVPVELCAVSTLKKLMLHGNRIYSLPHQIFQMDHLDDLFLRMCATAAATATATTATTTATAAYYYYNDFYIYFSI